MAPLLSVIIPVYNVEPYLEQCVSSVLAQTYKNLEIILVDDGSQDNSPYICDVFSKLDRRVKCLHKKNRGLVSARKTGLGIATGVYAAYVDSDDWLDEDWLESLMEQILKRNADVVCAGLIKEKGIKPFEERNQVPPGVYKAKEELEFLYNMMLDRGDYGHFGILPFLATKLAKRELLMSAQKDVDERIVVGEDVACTYPLLLNAGTIVISELCGYHYRIRDDSLSSLSEASKVKSFSEMVILRDYLHKRFAESAYMETLILQVRRYFIWGLLMKFPHKAFNEHTGASLVFDNLHLGERVAVYGGGAFGKDIALGFRRGEICPLVIWVDKDFLNPQKSRYGIVAPDVLPSHSFDKVVLATVHESFLHEMDKSVSVMGIPCEKIAKPIPDIIRGNHAIEVKV